MGIKRLSLSLFLFLFVTMWNRPSGKMVGEIFVDSKKLWTDFNEMVTKMV